jgi:MFS family permease
VVLASVLTASIGMALAWLAPNYQWLALLRAITGLGIGGILPSATVLVAEYSSDKWRNTASALYTAGYPLGGTLGGAVAAVLIAHYGWRAAFGLGAFASALMLPVTYWCLPESLDYLIARRPADALCKLNRLLHKMGHERVAVLPQAKEGPAGIPPDSSFALLSRGLARPTILIWVAFFFMMSGYYFVFSWTPKLLGSVGLTVQQGINGGVLLSLGGIIGTVLFAFIARSRDVRRLTLLCLLLSAMLMGVFAAIAQNPAIGLVIGVILGGTSTSAMAGLYALTPTLYGSDTRATGMGWAIGTGRVGAILAPMATGELLDLGWHTAQLFDLFAASFLFACLALVGVWPRQPPGTLSRLPVS